MRSMVEGQCRLGFPVFPLHHAASRRGPPPRDKLGEEKEPSFYTSLALIGGSRREADFAPA
jgi:hypothetical protein